MRPVPADPSRLRPQARIVAALALVVVGLALAACAPAAQAVLAPPTFRIVSEESGLARLDLPGFRDAGATFRVVIDVANPNAVPLQLAELDGHFFLGGVRVAAASFAGGIDLPPRGTARLVLDVRVSADELPGILAGVAEVVAGRPVVYRIDAAVGIDLFGVAQRFGSATIAQGTVQHDIGLRAPTVRLDPDATRVRSVSFDGITIDLALRVQNPNVVGVLLRAPDVRVRIGERDVALVQLVPERLAAGAETVLVQRLVINPVQLGAAIVTQLQGLASGGSASVDIAISGAWELEVPGLRSLRFDVAEIVRGRLE